MTHACSIVTFNAQNAPQAAWSYVEIIWAEIVFVFAIGSYVIYATNKTLKEEMKEHRMSERTYQLHKALIRSLIVQVRSFFTVLVHQWIL